MLTDVQIAQSAEMKPIKEIAEQLGLGEEDLELYGKYKAKISLETISKVKDNPDGKLILVTAINPTPAGEGKTTMVLQIIAKLTRGEAILPTVSLTDDKEKTKKLNEIEKKQFDLISILLNRENKESAIKKLQLMLKQKTKPFFIWHLEFSEVFDNGGFDIVIGNPPYISTKGIDAKDKPALKEEYGFADDTYSHFYFLDLIC